MNAPAVLALVAFALTSATGLCAQDASQISKGTRVRVTGLDERGRPATPVVGTLQRLAQDTVEVLVDSTALRVITLGSGSKLEASNGSKGHGAVGAVVGGLAGILVTSQAWQSCGECESGLPFGGVLVGAAGGGLLGLAVGSAFRSERWVVVETDGLRIVAGPAWLGLRVPL